ncbi:MAG: hypothetical protein JXA07_07610 [Spirochaetes bacterium]|nr:hypothetical protein [Spirochaetota bacterium]
MKERRPCVDIETLRERWRKARSEKLLRKAELLAAGADLAAVRRDRAFRSARKEQRRYAGMIRHRERTMNRKRARETNEA